MAFVRPLLLAAALALLTLLAWLPVLGNGFVLLDDGMYVTANSRVKQGITGEGLVWLATANVGNNWHPLTVLSHMLDCELYGLEPAGHHLTSLLLHLANVLLPISTFVETSGTYVNLEGLWQSFAGAAKPLGEARPGWKVLRVLGNLADVRDFDYQSSEEVREELRIRCADIAAGSYQGTLEVEPVV